MNVIEEIKIERFRQIEVEGWTYEHDDKYNNGTLSDAAAAYALQKDGMTWRDEIIDRIWPWDGDWWKPTSHRHNLIKAAALIVAEIERLDRMKS